MPWTLILHQLPVGISYEALSRKDSRTFKERWIPSRHSSALGRGDVFGRVEREGSDIG